MNLSYNIFTSAKMSEKANIINKYFDIVDEGDKPIEVGLLVLKLQNRNYIVTRNHCLMTQFFIFFIFPKLNRRILKWYEPDVIMVQEPRIYRSRKNSLSGLATRGTTTKPIDMKMKVFTYSPIKRHELRRE